jgi:hypothetical protein
LQGVQTANANRLLSWDAVPATAAVEVLAKVSSHVTATDNFNRANANPIGGNWSTVGGLTAMQVTNNAVTGTVHGTDNAVYWNANTFSNDQYSQFRVLSVSHVYKGLIVRCNGNNMYLAEVRDNSIAFWKYVNGAWTWLGSGSITQAAGDIFKFTATGTKLELFQNGISRGSVNDSSLTSGSPGIHSMSSSTTDTIDDWEGGSISQTVARVYLRGSGASGSETGYFAGLVSGGGLALYKLVSGVQTVIGTAPFSWSLSNWYWVRLRANGTSITAKVWQDGNTEPGTWNINASDTSVSSGGWVGVGTASSLDSPYYDYFSVGLSGQTAPGP